MRLEAVRAAAIAVAFSILATAARAQVSPGPLARAHAEWDGAAHCLKCHGRGEGTMDARCLDCHVEIARLRAAGRGLHAREGKGACAPCHPDHAGRDFALVDWRGRGPSGFDHARAGFTLRGRHADLACAACHEKKKKGRGRFTGLDPACASCHTDPHRGTLGTSCERCHGETSWRPAPGFDHANSGFPLLGGHRSVPCAKCHRPSEVQPKELLFKPLAHGSCSACHADPHAGRFGPNCGGCHVVDDWKRIAPETFDHARTRFPLAGRHRSVACASCHGPGKGWGKKPPFATCASCHADAHAATATLGGRPADCSACHDTAGWRPSTFDASRHRFGPYPLEGKHASVPCERCHGRGAEGVGTARVRLRPSHAACRDCHADAHAGVFAARADRGACEACHTVASWSPSKWGAAQHAHLRLALEGRHALVACGACHDPQREWNRRRAAPQDGKARAVLTGVPFACAACHADPHAGRYAPKGRFPAPGGCGDCHAVSSFRPSTLGVAAHRPFGFPLEGAHGAVPCGSCHKPAPKGASLEIVDTRCAACHKNPHGDQFARREDRGACEACHDVTAFRPASRFDHAVDASFALDGAHRRLPCVSCHKSPGQSDPKAPFRWKPVPHRCEDCHHGRRAGGGA